MDYIFIILIIVNLYLLLDILKNWKQSEKSKIQLGINVILVNIIIWFVSFYFDQIPSIIESSLFWPLLIIFMIGKSVFDFYSYRRLAKSEKKYFILKKILLIFVVLALIVYINNGNI